MYFLVGLPFVRLARSAERRFAPELRGQAIGGKQRQTD